MALTKSRLEVSLCLLIGVGEDMRFLRKVSETIKTRGVLMPPKWGCGGQEVPEGEAGSDFRSKGLRVQGSKGLRV